MPASAKLNSTPPAQRHMRKGSKGFTLVELLFVVAIIGVLAAIAIPAYNSYVDKAKITVAIGTLDAIRKDFESYHIDHQEYPPEPIDFDTGIDDANRTALSGMLLNQIDTDLTDVIYNTVTNGYLLTAKAKDKYQTLMTLTPTEISY